METIYVEQFVDCFQRFIALCQLDNWPNENTTTEQIKNAFLISQHIETCRDKLSQKNILSEFTLVLNKKLKISSLILKNYLSAPPRYVLKKIIISSVNIDLIDAGLKIFIDLHSEERLEVYLSDIMLEVASKDTLLKNMSTEISKSNQLEFKSQLFLSKLDENSFEVIDEILKDCKQDVVDMFVECLLNENPKYTDAIKMLSKAFTDVMLTQSVQYKTFWKLLFHTDEVKFIQMCSKHEDIFALICKALIDCGKLFEQAMSMEYFYINFTYSELSSIVQKICKNGKLKVVFLDLIYQSKVSLDFWEREIQNSC